MNQTTPQIFAPVLSGEHWVVYCINMIHKQIDILDPMEWEVTNQKHRKHTSFCVQLQRRLAELLVIYTDFRFPDISDWGMPYIPTPYQDEENDCAFFCMTFLEFYNGKTRQIELPADQVGNQNSVTHICYMLTFFGMNITNKTSLPMLSRLTRKPCVPGRFTT